jgi:apolipoprotein N-acyltransferase
VNKFITSPYLQAFVAGAIAVFGFAPFGLFPLPGLALAVLFLLWSRAERPAQAAWLGFAFGMGLFCVGISWIYVALHVYGYMHPILAAIATALFAAVNATLPALAGYAVHRVGALLAPSPRRGEGRGEGQHLKILFIMPAIWTLAEWLRGLLFTGFPWLSIGYSQVPNSLLDGYAPLLGVYGVSLMVAVSAAILVMLWNVRWNKQGKIAMAVLLAVWAGGMLLHSIEWTHPEGEPFKVALLQGNIAQDEKFEEGKLVNTLDTYRRLAQNSDARLIVMPETALPMLRQNVPEGYQRVLGDHARRKDGDILIGAFEKEDGNYYNSVYSLGSAESQHYRKNHLVPFGEFIPLRSVFGWFVNEVLQIPMGDQTSGGANQPPLAVAGQKVAVDICYEDAFGEEIVHALPQATLLVNVTNDAWYGDSFAAIQHNQLSQTRALETGRMMLRATNTGVTSIIGPRGRILAMLPQHEEGVLNGVAQGYVGSTPYVIWGNGAVLVLIAGMLLVAWRLQRR